MSSAVFGAPAGASLAIGDLGQMARTDLTNAEAEQTRTLLPGRLALQPVELAHQQALGRLANAQAGASEQALRESQAMQAAMGKIAAGGGSNATDPLVVIPKLMQGALEGGAPRKYMDLAKEYGVIYGHKTASDAQAARSRFEDANTMIKSYDWLSRNIGRAQDQEGLDAISNEYNLLFPQYQQALGAPSPIAGKTFSPELVKTYENAGMTEAQRMTQQLNREKFEFQQREKERQEELKRIGAQIKSETERRKADDAAQKAKIGALNRKPSDVDIRELVSMYKRDNPDSTASSADVLSFATKAAEDAQRIRAENPSVTPAEARFRAYGANKDDFQIQTTTNSFLGIEYGKKATTKYAPNAPGTRNNPIPGSSGMKPEEGKYYTVNGKVGLVKNGRVELVQ